VLDGTAMIDVDGEQLLVGEREALAVPAPPVDDDAEVAG